MNDASSQPVDFFYAHFQESLTYAFCAALIVVYAWDRFNTPPSNRSSTRQMLYWQSCVGYILSALGLFGALSLLLEQQIWRELLGLKDNESLPAPLLATLAMTTLLPRVPMVNQLDRWLLDLFLDLAAIPAEVKRRAAALAPHAFAVTPDDVMALSEGAGDDGFAAYGDNFAAHLRDHGAAGLELSRLRFTRVVKLYAEIRKLTVERRYSRFFDQNAEDFAELATAIETFIRGAVTELDFEGRVHGLAADDAYQETMKARQRKFADDCRQQFIAMARFLARAVLRSEGSEKEIVARLRQIGFTAAEPISAPKFPLNSLTALGLGIFGYLVVMTIWFSHHNGVQAPAGLVMAGKLTITRLASIGLTIWLVQQFAFFRREPGDPPLYFAYLLNGSLGGALAAGIWAVFRTGPVFGFSIDEVRIGILSGMLCAAIAFCCDDTVEGRIPPIWLRFAEAIGCGLAMAVGSVLIYVLGWAPSMPKLTNAWALTSWILLPSAMAIIVGACVPHIYREARRAAATRLSSAMPPAALPPPALAAVPVAPVAPEHIEKAA